MTANRQDGERLAAAERKRFAAVRLSRALAAGLAEPETARLDGDLRAALPSACGERGEEKILYLDTDIIVNGPLTELWDTPLDSGAALAGVIDQGALNLWGELYANPKLRRDSRIPERRNPVDESRPDPRPFARPRGARPAEPPPLPIRRPGCFEYRLQGADRRPR